MPFAPRIRKEILQALDEHILPALWKQQVPLGYVTLPLQFPRGIERILLRPSLPRRDAESLAFPILTSWTKARLHSTSHSYLSFIYEGIADERTLVMAAQSSKYKLAKGIYALRWKAPGVLFFPPGIARNTGAYKFFREDSPPQFSSVKILQLAIRDSEILVHTHTETAKNTESSHSLQINDTALLAEAGLFQVELQHAPITGQDAAQAMLLAFMLRLRNQLSSHPASIANTSHPQTIEAKSSNKHTQVFCQKAVQFIQTHLHESLSLPMIAGEVELSPAHLNRLFRQTIGVSVMRYVRQQRINAAKSILISGSESINEIALLLNFKRAAAFCNLFHTKQA